MTETPDARKINIPGYTLKRELGRGGMATVYLAVQDSLEREVAIKVMAPALGADPTFAARFRREARTIAKLSHPNVIPIYDIGVTDDHFYYFSMQYLAGGDLKNRIGNKFSDKDVVAIMQGITNALSFAHSHGFAHRDVKPENILFDRGGTPMLTDFGIARAIASDTHLTGTGVSVGTTRYMSPEQAKGGEIDERTDIYSVGVVLYEMLTGKAVYEADDGFAMAYAHVHEPIPRLPQKHAKWQPVIDRALAKEPSERFEDAEDLYAAVEECAGVRVKTHERVSKPSALAGVSRSISQVGPAIMGSVSSAGKWVDEELVPKLPPQVGKPLKGNRPLQGGIVALPILLILVLVFAMSGDEHPVTEPVVFTQDEPGALETDTLLSETETDTAGGVDVDSGEQQAGEGAGEGALAAGGEEVSTEIADLLAAAAEDIASDRLTTPPGSNALERFQAVLALDPNNTEAQLGLSRIVARYIDLVDAQLARGDPAGAMRYLDRAKAVKADDPQVLAAAQRVEPMREQAYTSLVEKGRAAIAAANKSAAVRAFRDAVGIRPEGELALAGLAEAQAMSESADVFSDEMVTGSSGPEMILVGRGSFIMGDEVAVAIDKPFALARHETTVGEFRRFLDESGYYGRKGHGRSCLTYAGRWREMRGLRWERPEFAQGEENPVVCITWEDAEAYAEWMAVQTGEPYRLPTEAEWEYAARQGFADDTLNNDPCTYGNVADQMFHIQFPREDAMDCTDGALYPTSVGKFKPNSLGLHEMVGNVREWIQDCWNREHAGRPADGSARMDGDCRQKVMKGSSWISGPGTFFVQTRVGEPPDRAFNTVGFRVARDVSPD